MVRPLRIEFEDALYHMTSRGNRREAIFEDDADRMRWMDILKDVMAQTAWRCHAYCLMDNHYHLVIETPHTNLAKGMRQLNGVYTQAFNRRHDRTGHIFQGRYKSIIVDSDSYFVDLCRYVMLNPVRAGMVQDAGDWPWSRYRATVGMAKQNEAILNSTRLLGYFSGQGASAQQQLKSFIRHGMDDKSICGST